MSRAQFPMAIHKGSVQVKIYRCPRKTGYTDYCVVYYQDGVRKRNNFSDFSRAKKEAEFVAERLGSKDADVLVLTSADRAAYQLARRILDPLGVSLESAALQFAEAVKRLGSVPLGEAVTFYLHWRPKEPTVRTVPEVVAEFVDSKELARLSNVHVKSLRYMLSKFAARFKGPIGEVTGPEIDVWLRQTGLSARTRNNVRGAIGSLFNFAKRERYLPRDHNELEAVIVVKEPPTEIEVFTPAELTEILCFTPARLIPFMVLGAFAGVRHAEIQRLDWGDIRLEEGHLVVRAAKAKTASRRIVPLVGNLREWLGPARREEGPVCELTNMANEIHDIVVKINAGRSQPFRWKQNGLRHSFVSYRVAEIQNVDQVALEAGTSWEMVFKNYRALVTTAAAKEWFAITPRSVEEAKRTFGNRAAAGMPSGSGEDRGVPSEGAA